VTNGKNNPTEPISITLNVAEKVHPIYLQMQWYCV